MSGEIDRMGRVMAPDIATYASVHERLIGDSDLFDVRSSVATPGSTRSAWALLTPCRRDRPARNHWVVRGRSATTVPGGVVERCSSPSHGELGASFNSASMEVAAPSHLTSAGRANGRPAASRSTLSASLPGRPQCARWPSQPRRRQ